jgi:hypothetical protein
VVCAEAVSENVVSGVATNINAMSHARPTGNNRRILSSLKPLKKQPNQFQF